MSSNNENKLSRRTVLHGMAAVSLAQILSAVDVDCPIPTEAFAAVSEVLNYIYRANNQAPAGFAVNTPTGHRP